ncbi:MAG TPA: glycerophosphodiester phosphodiesterase family protein [Gemmatimonadaceae bacterium]|nr:glycerophosphodiester phosphodiesterase family protein [Gemmatimonadaceae bacterium]
MSVIHEPGPPLVIGHRGAAAVQPENTLPSFEHAIALGVDAIEFDVRVSRDGVAVVHHDPSTRRTCGEDLVVEHTGLATLRALDAAATYTGRFTPVRRAAIPLLDEVLELTRDIPVIIECKTTECVAPVLAAIAAHGVTDRVVIGSFLDAAMHEVRAASVASGAARGDMIRMAARGLVRLAPRTMPYRAMCIPERSNGITLPIARLARWGRALGVPVHVWTVNHVPDAMRLWDQGVTGIMTDDPAAMLEARRNRLRR